MQVCLLAAWIRTGVWVTVEGRQHLRIRLVQDGDTSPTELTFSVQLNDGKVRQPAFKTCMHMNRMVKLA
jgi:hypothetical protein